MGTKKAVYSDQMGLPLHFGVRERRCERPCEEWSIDTLLQRKIRVLCPHSNLRWPNQPGLLDAICVDRNRSSQPSPLHTSVPLIKGLFDAICDDRNWSSQHSPLHTCVPLINAIMRHLSSALINARAQVECLEDRRNGIGLANPGDKVAHLNPLIPHARFPGLTNSFVLGIVALFFMLVLVTVCLF